MANFTWVNAAAWAGIDIEEFPNVKAWWEKLKARPGFVLGMNVPEKAKADPKDPKEVEKIAKEASSWIMNGMNDDRKK